MVSLGGYTALITGASGGIGVCIAKELAHAGTNLALAGRSIPELERLATTFSSDTQKSIAIPSDLSETGAETLLFNAVQQQFGAVDILINNAGIELTHPYQTLSSQEIELIIRVNLTSAMLLTRLVLPGMLSRRRGHIVNVASLAGKVGPPYCGPYAATKAALIIFTQSIRSELRGTGVSASVVTPGNVQTGIYQRLINETSATGPTILGPSAPDKVARAVLRSIKKDLPEIIVNPWPVRPLIALAELSPILAQWLMKQFGITHWFRTLAQMRENKREG